MRNVINVSNRLPISLSPEIRKSSGGLVAALQATGGDASATQWIGWPGSHVEEPQQQGLDELLRRDFGCIPVFLTPEEIEGFYIGFSNSSLWPLLHYMPSRFRYQPHWWDHYQAVNRRFAERVLSVAQDGDLVWVHDYQLMLLPAMLREARPSLRIGFFLHTPFPSYEVFRFHPKRAEVLAGLLGADQVGFHTFGYLRHFRSAVLRLLGIDSELMRIRHEGRSTYLGIYPIGINAAAFEAELRSPQFAEQLAATRSAHQNQRVIVSVERLDYTKGLLHRLDAIDLFLASTSAEARENLKFVFVSVPSRQDVKEYRLLREEVERRIGRLNGKYATLHNSPVHFIHGSVSFTELCALYAVADVGMVTPLIDGMNLVAKEYVACQRDDPGCLILSEFAGAAEELFNAVLVNPYDGQAMADALRQALDMSPQERRWRMEPMRRRVMTADAGNWARSFIQDLASRASEADERSSIEQAKQQVIGELRRGRRAAFFIDYDGTLRELERDPHAAVPNAAVLAVLDRLRDHPLIDVTIVSGRVSEDLEAFLGHYPFALVAEHGASVRRSGQTEWEQLDRNVSYAWKQELMKVLRLYEYSTPGSFIEDKRTSLVWHYRKADPEFGTWKANELAEELGALTANEPLHVRHGRKIVEVTAAAINKSAAVSRLLEGTDYGVVLVTGDDLTDESMFDLDIQNLISIKVGYGETHARFRVAKPGALRRLLMDMATAELRASGDEQPALATTS